MKTVTTNYTVQDFIAARERTEIVSFPRQADS